MAMNPACIVDNNIVALLGELRGPLPGADFAVAAGSAPTDRPRGSQTHL